MPKYSGLFQIEGKLYGLSFYQTADGPRVRKAGGVSKARIMNDPSFARTRENMNEFACVAKANKLLRTGFGSAAEQFKDRKAQQRITLLLFEILRLDLISKRGQRKISKGIATAEGKEKLKGFNFNDGSKMEHILPNGYVLDRTEATLTMTGIEPGRNFKFPQEATDFQITLIESYIDFSTGESVFHESTPFREKTDVSSFSGILEFSSPLAGSGTHFFALAIEFLQEVNGKLYALKNGMYHVVTLLEVV